MTLWLIVPRDPLIFRDGKPFTSIPGERSKSMVFPFPSTTTGAVRTRAGTDPSTGKFASNRIPELLQTPIRGPILVEMDENGKFKKDGWLFPAPADALLVQKQPGEEPWRYWLSPIEIPAGSISDMKGLNPVGPATNIKGKPLSQPPRYWNWIQYQAWLDEPLDEQITLKSLGIKGPERENRTHVSVDAASQTGLPGRLFQTSGMEFVKSGEKNNSTTPLKDLQSLALALETSADLQDGVGFLGGESRFASWQKSEVKLPDFPAETRNKILNQGSCRLILTTPALFEKGFLPAWLEQTYGVEVVAAAVPRYQTISGWDYKLRSPKPTRRLTPTGSVYFLKPKSGVSLSEKFLDEIWMHTISDDEQSRLDGFGMALLGTWDGNLKKMEVKS